MSSKAVRNVSRADTELAAAAVDAVKWLTTIPVEAVRVTAHNGWLELEGEVQWSHQRQTLEEVTRHLPGVEGVSNHVQIKSIPVQPDISSLLGNSEFQNR